MQGRHKQDFVVFERIKSHPMDVVVYPVFDFCKKQSYIDFC